MCLSIKWNIKCGIEVLYSLFLPSQKKKKNLYFYIYRQSLVTKLIVILGYKIGCKL